MLPKTQAHHHHNQMTGFKGFLHAVEGGLKLYGMAKGVYEAGQAVAGAARMAAPIVASML